MESPKWTSAGLNGRSTILGKNCEQSCAPSPRIEVSEPPASEMSPSARVFDARPDVDAYVQNKLGPSLEMRANGPALIAGLLGTLPTIGVIGGLILFGLPPLSAVSGFLALLVPCVALLSLMSYYIWKARVRPPEYPSSFTLDADGVYFRDRYGLHDLVDWDSPNLFLVLMDKRPRSNLDSGTDSDSNRDRRIRDDYVPRSGTVV